MSIIISFFTFAEANHSMLTPTIETMANEKQRLTHDESSYLIKMRINADGTLTSLLRRLPINADKSPLKAVIGLEELDKFRSLLNNFTLNTYRNGQRFDNWVDCYHGFLEIIQKLDLPANHAATTQQTHELAPKNKANNADEEKKFLEELENIGPLGILQRIRKMENTLDIALNNPERA